MFALNLIRNISLIITLSIVYQIIMRFRAEPGIREKVLAGLLFGIIAMTGMISPVYFAPGLFFDGRSIILTIAGLFGGPLPALISAVMSSAFRYHIGGVGTATGILTIAESAAIGTLFYYLKKKKPFFITLPWLFFIAVLVHAVMLLCMLAIPGGSGIAVMKAIASPVLLVYPPATVIVAFVFLNQEKRRFVENSLKVSEKKYRDYVEYSPYGIFITDIEGKFIEVNRKASLITGYKKSELLAMRLGDIFQTDRRESAETHFREILSKGSYYGEFPFMKKGGDNTFCSVDAVNLGDHTVIGFVQDISERKKTEERLRYRLSIEMIITSFTTALVSSDLYDVDREIQTALKLLGTVTGTDRVYLFLYNQEISEFSNTHEWCADSITAHIDHFKNLPVDSYPWWTEKMNNNSVVIFQDIKDMPEEAENVKGIFIEHNILSIAVIPLFYDGKLTGFMGFDSIKKRKKWTEDDIDLLKLTGNIFCSALVRKSELEEKNILNEQLVQIQKLESIGRLAGGVAHDFNNILQVIMGFSEMAMEDIPEGPDSGNIKTYIEEIYKAAQRSAALTGQLLAFARRQTAKPEIINLNEVIENIIKMLKRLIGENIELIWNPSDKLWNTMIDISQVNQLITNLSVNSRDALEGRSSGKIIIETCNTVVSETDLKENAYFVPGEYVMLAVRDNGKGMDRETISHIFEPFYTTKGKEGTGLGLSTVYGIMKQNNGYINTISEVDEGTTMKLYFKRYAEHNYPAAQTIQEQEIQTLSQRTILIVEDEATILSLASEILKRAGFRVLTAENGEKAVSLSGSSNVKIDLLITDVVLPEMNGKKLAEVILESIPDIKILYMSGYTANVIAHQGILDEGINFIQKPFSVKNLLTKVNQILTEDSLTV